MKIRPFALVSALALSAAALAQPPAAPPMTPGTPPADTDGGGGVKGKLASIPDFRRIVQDSKEKVFPSVVYIRVIRESTEYGKKELQAISGSGVIISPEGEVLTNWHVIDKAATVRCLMSNGEHYDAKVVGSDKDTDLAVIKLQNVPKESPLPYAALGDSNLLKEGDFVMAMGAPWGLNRSVSIGIISCTKRYLESCSEYAHWLQTDAAINPGNSGGPMVNTNGEIVGINSRGMAGYAEGMGFAIPSEAIKVLLPQLRQHGKVNWTWTGLQLQPLRDFNKDIFFNEKDGVIVGETDPESPARRAGFLPKDRIVRVNGQPVTAVSEEDLPQLNRLMGLLTKGAEATLDIVREGKEMTVKFTPREKGKVEGEELPLERFDLTLKTINQFDNQDLYFYKKEGVFVFGLKYPGNASNAGFYQGDIVTKIDGKDVTTLDDVRKLHTDLVANVEAKNRVVVTVLRRGTMRQVVLDFQRDYAKE